MLGLLVQERERAVLLLVQERVLARQEAEGQLLQAQPQREVLRAGVLSAALSAED